MRAINRKWLSSKLHPIIIETKTQDKQSEIAARHKVTDNADERPRILAQTYNKPKNNTAEEYKQPAVTKTAARRERRTSNAPIHKIKDL